MNLLVFLLLLGSVGAFYHHGFYESGSCHDSIQFCGMLRATCHLNFAGWSSPMKLVCAKTCGFCKERTTSPTEVHKAIAKECTGADRPACNVANCDDFMFASYMTEYCPRTCGLCRDSAATVPEAAEIVARALPVETTSTPTTVTTTQRDGTILVCKDTLESCKQYVRSCNSSAWKAPLTKYCARTCGFCQDYGTTETITTSAPLSTSTLTTVSTTKGCRDRSNCSNYLYLCQNPNWLRVMTQLCSKSCGFCHDAEVTEAATTELSTLPFETTAAPPTTLTTSETEGTTSACRDIAKDCAPYVYACNQPAWKPDLIRYCAKSCGFCHDEAVTEASTTELSTLPFETTLAPTTVTTSQTDGRTSACTDIREDCDSYVRFCNYPHLKATLAHHCAKSCGFCHDEAVTEASTTELSTRDPLPFETTEASPTTATSPSEECSDQLADCEVLSDQCGDPSLKHTMTNMCAKTCGFCKSPTTTVAPTTTEAPSTETTAAGCADQDAVCPQIAFLCAVPAWNDRMTTRCPKTCGICEEPTTTSAPSTFYRPFTEAAPCVDHYSYCSFNKVMCSSPTYGEEMMEDCPKTCGKCSAEEDAPIDEDAEWGDDFHDW